MSIALPKDRTFLSKDKRREATYFPLADFALEPPPALTAHKGPVYVVNRTVRTRRGFGTIIHTLTTFVNTRLKAHALAVKWVKVQTRDR